MTAASSDYGHRAVWAIAAPMIISSVTVPLLGMVDTAVMGHLDSPQYLAAVALGATIFSVLFTGLNFLRMGTTGLTAQSFGAGDNQAMGHILIRSVLTALGLALIILILSPLVIQVALILLAPEAGVGELTRKYFYIRMWAAPVALTNLALVGWLLGKNQPRAALMVIVVINLTNVVLDLWFVLGLGLDVEGVAAASVCAEIAGTCTGVWLVRLQPEVRRFHLELQRLLNGAAFRRLLQINTNLFIRTMALLFAFAFVMGRSARMGEVILASNAVLMNFVYLMAFALDGIANAAEVMVGRALGSRDRSGLETAVKNTLLWSGIFAAAFAGVYLTLGGLLIDVLTDIPSIRETARIYLPWLIASPLIAVWCFLYDGVYVGATLSREMRNVLLVATLLVFLPVWFVLRDWGNHALWLAFMCFFASRGLHMHLQFNGMLKHNRLPGLA